MKTTLPLLALLLLATPSARALDPALLGVGFTPASEAQPALDTTTREKVEDAWAYPITRAATLVPESATAVTRRAIVRRVDELWQVVAIKVSLTLKNKSDSDAFMESVGKVFPRKLTETIGTQTRISFQDKDEYMQLVSEPAADNATAFTLLVWRTPFAEGLFDVKVPNAERDLTETMTKPSSVAGTVKTFLGLPFGRPNRATRERVALKKTSYPTLYTFEPKKRFLAFKGYYAMLTKAGEIYQISAVMDTGKWDGRDEALGNIYYVASYVEKKYNCAHLREDHTDRFTSPRLRYRLEGTTIEVYASLDDENYDWTIWIVAEDNALAKKVDQAKTSQQLEAL